MVNFGEGTPILFENALYHPKFGARARSLMAAVVAFALASVILRVDSASAGMLGGAPSGPWSMMFESPLRDNLVKPLRTLAPGILSLSEPEVADLNGLLDKYVEESAAFFADGRKAKAGWDARFKGSEPADPSAERRKLLSEREEALAPLADRQAEMERMLIDLVRDRFSPGREPRWQRLLYALERARAPHVGGHLPTSEVDLPRLVDSIIDEYPESVLDREVLEALVATHCERSNRAISEIRAGFILSERTFFRRIWLQEQRSKDLPPAQVRNAPIFRGVDESRPRIRRAALDLAARNLSARPAIEANLAEPAKAEFTKRFWFAVAEKNQFVFWPKSVDRFREAAMGLASEEERQVITPLFDEAYRAAIQRLVTDEEWMRKRLDASYDGIPVSSGETAVGFRTRQDQGCKMLNALCKSVAEALDAVKRDKLRLPNFHIAEPQIEPATGDG